MSKRFLIVFTGFLFVASVAFAPDADAAPKAAEKVLRIQRCSPRVAPSVG